MYVVFPLRMAEYAERRKDILRGERKENSNLLTQLQQIRVLMVEAAGVII